MILAEKITQNRKKNGWSQEELADRLGVSRQSVSKWESAQSMPDMKKILQLSEVFDVSTDYLLKDEIDEDVPAEIVPVERGLEEEEVRSVSMEEASSFLQFNEGAARRISTGVMLCILSPVLLIILGGLAEAGRIPIRVMTAELAGITILLIMVSVAVAMFLTCAFRGKPYEYLERADIDTEYGVDGMVKERRTSYAENHSRLMILGIMMCVVSAVPMFLIEASHYSHDDGAAVAAGTGALLIMCAAGVKMIVLTSIRQGGMDRLLEEGDYTRLNKRVGKYDGIYWALATAIYLAWSFAGQRWEFTWIVWPVAGVLFAVYREILKIIVRSRS